MKKAIKRIRSLTWLDLVLWSPTLLTFVYLFN